MNKNQILKICDTFHLGTLVSDAIPVRGGLIHRMWKITTSSGSFAIKELDPVIMNRPGIHESYILSEKISYVLKSKNIPAETALINQDMPLYEVDGSTVMIFPWVEGKTLTCNQVTNERAKKIGGILAEIHAKNIIISDLPIPEIHSVSEERWHFLADEAVSNKLVWATEANANLPNLIAWSEAYRNAKQQLNKNLVISHRDMDPKNVLWRDNLSPVLIDWEGSGLINRTEEVINVSIGWSGETEVLFRKDIFLSVIEGYYNSGGHVNEYEIHDALHGFIGGYLAWLEFNMSRSLGSSKYDIESQQLGVSETKMTFKKLHFLSANIDYLIELSMTKKLKGADSENKF